MRQSLVFCGDARRLERLGELRDHQAGNGKLEGFFNAVVDAALALQTFVLAAETAGLGRCSISAIRNHPDAVAEQGVSYRRFVCRLSRCCRVHQHAPTA
jgi:nitroreductase